MLHGRHKFYTHFDEKPKLEKTFSKQRGRSKQRHERRNECLCDRYFFYGKIRRLNYEDVLTVLQKEFFIAPITISEIVDDNHSQLTKLKKEQTTIKQLSQKWPSLNWKVDGRELLN